MSSLTTSVHIRTFLAQSWLESKLFAMTYSRALTFQKLCFYLVQQKSHKNDEKCFLFYVKSFSFLRYLIFSPTFWLCRKTTS